MNPPELILASSSPFRKELLQRLHIEFKTISPDIDETHKESESPTQYVKRLALEKAQAIAVTHPDSIVIGSDQCAYLDGIILGKPGNHQNAVQQLHNARNQEVVFYTGLCVVQSSTQFCEVDCIEFRVGFRDISDQQIEHYLNVEQPYNCAGSFKSEGYGVCLFSYLKGDDPSALMGLPLIRLITMLVQAGIKVV